MDNDGMYHDDFMDYDEEEEYIRLTTDGVHMIGEMYLRAKRGCPIEILEEEFDLITGQPGTEEYHLDWKILMTIGDLSGLFDHIEELLELDEQLDNVIKDF